MALPFPTDTNVLIPLNAEGHRRVPHLLPERIHGRFDLILLFPQLSALFRASHKIKKIQLLRCLICGDQMTDPDRDGSDRIPDFPVLTDQLHSRIPDLLLQPGIMPQSRLPLDRLQ